MVNTFSRCFKGNCLPTRVDRFNGLLLSFHGAVEENKSVLDRDGENCFKIKAKQELKINIQPNSST